MADARHRRRAAAIAGLAAALAATLVFPPRPLLVWNVSASAPIGLYAVIPTRPERGDMTIARLPDAYRLFAARRHYLPLNVPLVKRIAATPGDTVCAFGRSVYVNGRRVAVRQVLDGAGRPLPSWRGCTVLGEEMYFLLMDDQASFDGRYFGPTSAREIIGKAHLLWAR